jgi:hypothetical protein
MKQIRFNCPCGATNYRDGSAEITKKKIKKLAKDPAKPVHGPVKVLKEATVHEVSGIIIERSEERNDEASEESPLII